MDDHEADVQHDTRSDAATVTENNGTTTTTPRVWPKGSPEPVDVAAVRGIIMIWTKGPDGLWHSLRTPEIAYPWATLNRHYALTEVTTPSFRDLFFSGKR